MKKCPNNKIKAFGLVEVLVSLAIFSIAIISITSMNVKSYKIIKNNELADLANRTMVKTLEFFKSPTTTNNISDPNLTLISTQEYINDAFNNYPGSTIVSFYSTSELDLQSGDPNFPILSFGYNSRSSPINICSTSTPTVFNVAFKNTGEYYGFFLCNQIMVEKSISGNGYVIKSRIVYILNGQTYTNELIGYRPITDVSDD